MAPLNCGHWEIKYFRETYGRLIWFTAFDIDHLNIAEAVMLELWDSVLCWAL